MPAGGSGICPHAAALSISSSPCLGPVAIVSTSQLEISSVLLWATRYIYGNVSLKPEQNDRWFTVGKLTGVRLRRRLLQTIREATRHISLTTRLGCAT